MSFFIYISSRDICIINSKDACCFLPHTAFDHVVDSRKQKTDNAEESSRMMFAAFRGRERGKEGERATISFRVKLSIKLISRMDAQNSGNNRTIACDYQETTHK